MESHEQIAAVSIKIPPVWPADMKAWFTVIEAQFSCLGITKELTKFYHLVGALTPELASRFSHATTTTGETPYTTLREAMLSEMRNSDLANVDFLLNNIEIGDRKPSALLHHLRSICSDLGLNDRFIKALFIKKLPPTIRTVVAIAEDVPLTQLAKMADRVAEADAQQTYIAAFARQPSQERKEITNPAWHEEMQRLVHQMETNLRAEFQGRNRQRSPNSYSRNPSPSRRSNRAPLKDAADGLCWYHTNFGPNARHCRSPCRRSGNAIARE